MSGLIQLPENAMVQQPQDNVMATICKAVNFLPRLQLCQASSAPVTANKARAGEFVVVISQEELINAGSSVVMIPIVYRYTALDMSGDKVISVHHKVGEEWTKPVFKDIVNRADNTKDSNCSYGPETLVYLPEQDLLATFMCGSKTTRNSFPDIAALKGRGATLTAKFIEPKASKFKWWCFTVAPFSGEFSNQPKQDVLQLEVERYLHPIDSSVELADTTTASDDRAR